MPPGTVRVLHISDIHFGKSYVEAHVAAAEALAVERAGSAAALSAIVVSGDLSQRARPEEFRQARALLDRFAAVAPVLVVPGNHDTEWWHAPFGVGRPERLHETYQSLITPELEPTLRVPGVSIVGLNSANGMLPRALTFYPRDWRVKGGLSRDQLDRARRELLGSPAGDLRILVLHHNLVRGNLSNRWGLARPEATLDAIAAMAPDVVCTGHDHEERAELVTRAAGSFLLSTANTLSRRARGKRTASLNMIEADSTHVRLEVWHFDAERGTFVVQRETRAPRHGHAASSR